MKADINNLQSLFATDVRFLIPIFQRRYVWEEEKQWKPLWEDVSSTAERYLREKGTIPVDDMRGHFIGAVVFQFQPHDTKECPKRLVIDGQQRLTTLQLLIGATQKVFEDFDDQSADRLRKFVLNDESRIHDDRDHIFKVWPTLKDQAAFRHAMSNEPMNNEYKNSQIVKAHTFFKQQVHEWINGNPEERVEALEATMTRLLRTAVISMDATDDPNIIFEVLNDRGTPLIQAELVKNFILYKAGDDGVKIHHNHWQKLESNWWMKDTRQGRLFRPRVDTFLHYWITMQRKSEVQTSNVFGAIREYVDKEYADDSIWEVASQIGNMADIYHDIYQRIPKTEKSGRADTALDRFLYRWNAMDMGVLTPVLLRLLSFKLPSEKLERCLHIIESYLVRRMVCGMSAKDYNNLFLLLLQILEKENADETIRTFLEKQTADDRIWPSDSMLDNAFLHESLYRLRSRGRLRFVLVGMENWLREGKTEEQGWKEFNIEHVMPQAWDENWPLLLDQSVLAEAKAERNRLIHTIGNLTLVTGKLNKSLSNAPWAEKRERLNTYSGLLLKESITSRDVWNEETIKERSRYLAEIATEVWPHAARI